MDAQGSGVDADKFWTGLARDAYTASTSYFDSNVRSRIIQDVRQFQNEHPEGSRYQTDAYKLKSRLFRPKTRSAIRKNEGIAAAAFFSTEDVVSVRPMDDNDPLHQASAELHKAILQYRLTRPHPHGIPWFLTAMGAYQEAQSVGVVASYQDWKFDEDKGIDRPDITLLPVENYRFDVAADWRDVVNTSPYFIILWPMYAKDVKARMEKEKWRWYPDSQLQSATRDQNDSIRLAREQGGTDSKDASKDIRDFSIVWVHENFIEVDGVDMVFKTLGSELILTDPEPVKNRYPQGRPVVVGFSIIEAHKAYPSGVCSLTRDVQNELNDTCNLRMDNVKLVLNKRYFARRGADIDLRSLTRNIAGSVTLCNDPNADIKVITTDDATASSYQEQDRLNVEFDDLAGVFSTASVASNRTLNETVGGMNLLASNSNQVSEYQLRTFVETWMERVLRQLVVLTQSYEDNPLVLSLAGRSAEIGKHGFDQVTDEMMMQDVILNVNVGTGSTNPQTQVDRFMYGMNALAGLIPQKLQDVQADEVVKELFGKLGYRDGARFFRKAEDGVDPQVQQLRQMVQQLQAALDAKNPPEIVAATVAKLQAEATLKQVEATAKRVEALYSAMNTAQTAVTVPGITPVADAIALSAGFDDQNAPPIYPDAPQQDIPLAIPDNTSPMYPANPERGMLTGMESGVTP